MRGLFRTWQQVMINCLWAPPAWAHAGEDDRRALRLASAVILSGIFFGTVTLILLIACIATGNGFTWQAARWVQRLLDAHVAVLWVILVSRLYRKYRSRR